MNYLALRYILWVLNILVTCQTDDCIFGKVENKQLPCCTNYFLDNGECRECLPGYFGMNYSDRCVYPNYGYYCQNTCDCTVTDCNHVLGCKGNYTQIETSTSLWSKYTSSRNDYIHSLKINEECPPGYFGENCSSGCIYPAYGEHCQNTCDCNVKDCNHVDGCQRNHTQTETSTIWLTKHTSSGNGYTHTSKINEGSANLIQFLSVFTLSKISFTVDKTNNENKYNKKTVNGNLTIVIILVGCILAIVLAVNRITWISKFVQRKFGNSVNARDNFILETVYLEINAGSKQQESQANTIGANVITRSCTSLGGVETRPELPARNTINEKQNPCPAHTNKDDETYINV